MTKRNDDLGIHLVKQHPDKFKLTSEGHWQVKSNNEWFFLSDILKTKPQKGCGEFKVWEIDEWVIKKAQLPTRNVSGVGEVSFAKIVSKKYEKLKKLELDFIPETYYNEEHDVLIQIRIEDRMLQNNENNEFNRIKSEYEKKREKAGFCRNFIRIQKRNVMFDQNGKLWLFDLD